jgi:hypothetical protein
VRLCRHSPEVRERDQAKEYARGHEIGFHGSSLIGVGELTGLGYVP